MTELETEFFRVEAGSNPEGARARAYVRELQVAPNGERITPLERGALVYMAEYATDDGLTQPSLGALTAYLDIFSNHTKQVLLGLVFKGVLLPQISMCEWKDNDEHIYQFAELKTT